MMTPSASTPCPRCGGPITGKSPEGLCSRCLVSLPFETETDDRVESTRTPSSEEIAPHFPHLEIRQCLGRGGMGVVYKARQKSLDRFVALKLIASERADGAAFAAHFEREAKLLATLNHPNIVTIHDFGKAGDYYYLLMEYVDGMNLREAMSEGSLTSIRKIEIIRSVCDALHYAHGRGIVHRDIKPENLLLDRSGRVTVADFGIATLLDSETGESFAGKSVIAAGTPRYMAPEQREGGAADHRTDIYSVGVVLRELISAPEPGDKTVRSIPEIIRRATSEDRERRHSSAANLGDDLEKCARRKSRKPWLIATAVGVVLIATGGVAFTSIRNAMTPISSPAAPAEKPLPRPVAPPIPPRSAADWLTLLDLGLNQARWDWSDENFRRSLPLAAWESMSARRIASRTSLPPVSTTPLHPGERRARRFLTTFEGGFQWIETVVGFTRSDGSWLASGVSLTDPRHDSVGNVAWAILPLIDAGAYTEFRREASEIFRRKNPGTDWARQIALDREPLGQRVWQNARFLTDEQSGPVSGERIRFVMEIKSSYTRAASVTERITMGCDDDNRWRVDDYEVVDRSGLREPSPGFLPPPSLIEEPEKAALEWLRRRDAGETDPRVTISEATRRALAGSAPVPGGRKPALRARSPVFTAPSHAYGYFTYTGARFGNESTQETLRLKQDDEGRWSVVEYEVGPEEA